MLTKSIAFIRFQTFSLKVSNMRSSGWTRIFLNIFVKTQLDENSQNLKNFTQFLAKTPTILRKTQFSGKNIEFLLQYVSE